MFTREKDMDGDMLCTNKALEIAIASVEKEFGKGALMRLGDGENLGGDVQVVPSGSLGLDVGLGIGGYPRGRIVEIYGPESSGKTTLTLHAIASVQRAGGVAAFIDAEHALDVTYAKKLGVKSEELLISQPDFGEQALEIAEMLVRSNAVDIVVIDSVAALVPKAEIEGDMGDSHVGLQARLMSQALRKLTGTVSRSKTLLVFTNQNSHENRRDVRQSRDDHGRPGAEVLHVGAIGRPPDRRHRSRRPTRRGPRRRGQSNAREGREELDGASLPRGGVRHSVRSGHL